jgi:hypothetical protein
MILIGNLDVLTCFVNIQTVYEPHTISSKTDAKLKMVEVEIFTVPTGLFMSGIHCLPYTDTFPLGTGTRTLLNGTALILFFYAV